MTPVIDHTDGYTIFDKGTGPEKSEIGKKLAHSFEPIRYGFEGFNYVLALSKALEDSIKENNLEDARSLICHIQDVLAITQETLVQKRFFP